MSEAEFVYKVLDRSYTQGHVPTAFVEHVHYLKGMHGAVSFGWSECLQPKLLPANVDFLRASQAHDLGYHRYVRTAEWQYASDECRVLGDGKTCYGDGSSLNAHRLLEEWMLEGNDEAWLRTRLAQYYHEVFYDLVPVHDVQAMTFGQVISKLQHLLGETNV